jgi:hypothetical protein
MAELSDVGTGAAGAVAPATPAAVVPPWYRATLVLACPTCGVPPGHACVARVVSGRPVLRRAFHVERYVLARDLAGEPLRTTQTQPLPS